MIPKVLKYAINCKKHNECTWNLNDIKFINKVQSKNDKICLSTVIFEKIKYSFILWQFVLVIFHVVPLNRRTKILATSFRWLLILKMALKQSLLRNRVFSTRDKNKYLASPIFFFLHERNMLLIILRLNMSSFKIHLRLSIVCITFQ